MWSFLKAVWQVLVGIKDVVLTVLVIGLLLLVLRAVFASDTGPVVEDGAVLALSIDGYVVDQASPTDPASLIGGAASIPVETRLGDLLAGIRQATEDKRVSAIALELDGFFGAGPADLQSIARALKAFKMTGRPIYAYAHFYAEPQYYLASQADEIWMHPMGGVLLSGYDDHQLYFASALKKLGVTVNVFRAGRYKSAVEPYERDTMSDDAREASQALLGTLWGQYSAEVAASRKAKGFTVARLTNALPTQVERADGDLAKLALGVGAVDTLGTKRAFDAHLTELAGEGENADGLASYKQIALQDYLNATGAANRDGDTAVGIVYVSGEIIDGEAPSSRAGGATVSRMLYQAAEDDSIKAVVLRVNSPGGSTTASEQIREAVTAVQDAGKPVVVSMGTVAASGGYWVSSTSDEIWAEPGTITGSIGVFGMIPTFEGALAKFGIQSDGFGTTPLSGSEDLTRPLGQDVSAIIQSSVTHTYREFLRLVSTGRRQPVEKVDAIAQGRVWVATDLKRFGLVDNLGGIEDAIQAAAKRAKLKTYGVRDVVPEEGLESQLVRLLLAFGVKAHAPHRSDALTTLRRTAGQIAALGQVERVLAGPSVQASCLACMSFLPPPADARAPAAVLKTLLSAQ